MQNRPKYNAKKTIIGNLKFDSKKEAEYYLKLKEICTPEQRKELSKMFKPLFKQERRHRENTGRRGRQY